MSRNSLTHMTSALFNANIFITWTNVSEKETYSQVLIRQVWLLGNEPSFSHSSVSGKLIHLQNCEMSEKLLTLVLACFLQLTKTHMRLSISLKSYSNKYISNTTDFYFSFSHLCLLQNWKQNTSCIKVARYKSTYIYKSTIQIS